MANAMAPGDRIEFSTIADREPLKLPGDGRMIIWPVFALELWDIGRAMARTVIPAPQGVSLLPDVPNWTWHEYGMRVGFWRLKKMFEALKIRPTVTLNARVCENYPKVADACLEAGWEFNAHAYEQIPMHKVDDQRANIAKTLDVITRFCGKKPRGWFGPGLTQTFDTLDHLAAEGVEYIGDWALDDQPVQIQTTHGNVVAMPYNFEIHDIVMMAIQHHQSDAYKIRAIDYFDTLYAESAESVRIMALAMHPYLSGSAHRIRYVRETFEHILAQPGVVCWDGEQILDWYLQQRPLPT